MAEIKEDKGKEIDKLIEKINKDANKKGSKDPLIFNPAERRDLITPTFFATGIDEVDEALGGGLPKGSITTVWGPYNCGKTWFAMTAAAKVTKEGGYVLYVNLEGMPLSLFEKYLDLDLTKVREVNPRDHGDQIVDAIEALLYDKEKKCPVDLFDMVIVDSISNFVPKANTDKIDKDGSEGGGKVGAHAKLITDFLTRYYGRGINRGNQTVILISQVRSAIRTTGGSTGPEFQMSGGNAIHHDSKIIIKMGKKGTWMHVKEDGKTAVNTLVGHTVLMNIEKNSITGIPGKKAEYAVKYDGTRDDTLALISKAKSPEWGYIQTTKRGWSVIICPGLGDVEVKNSDLENVIRSRIEISHCLRETMAGGKPKTLPQRTGITFNVEIEEIKETE